MEMSETYSRLGWKVVLLHGVKGVGICSCHRGSECHTPGKHPVSNDWQSSATSSADLMDEWFASKEHVNVGLLLGPASGVIDVELDGAAVTIAEAGQGNSGAARHFVRSCHKKRALLEERGRARVIHRLFAKSYGVPPVVPLPPTAPCTGTSRNLRFSANEIFGVNVT